MELEKGLIKQLKGLRRELEGIRKELKLLRKTDRKNEESSDRGVAPNYHGHIGGGAVRKGMQRNL